MIELRPFLNCDSPGIAAVWSAQPPLRARLPQLTSDLLEQHVLSKPFFDPRDLIVALEGRHIIGFIHVGFQPTAPSGPVAARSVNSREDLARDGMVCQLQVVPRADSLLIAAQLLAAGTQRLRDAGARVLLGGSLGLYAPFYLGLYGGSRLPGILVADELMIDAVRAANFTEFRQVSIWQRELAGFRPPIDRDIVTLRRQYQFQISSDFVARNWRESCTFSWAEPLRVDVLSSPSGDKYATLTFWDCEPLAGSWGARFLGLADVSCDKGRPNPTLLAFFLAEAMRLLLSQGGAIMEVQTENSESDLADVCRKLGLREMDRGIQFRWEGEPISTPQDATGAR